MCALYSGSKRSIYIFVCGFICGMLLLYGSSKISYSSSLRTNYLKAEVLDTISRPPLQPSAAVQNQLKTHIQLSPTKRTNSIPVEKTSAEESTENREVKKENVFFLKVHKAASTTVLNLLLRYAMKNDKNVLFPKTGNHINQSGIRIPENGTVELPPGMKFHILCNHIIFDEKELSKYFPRNTTLYLGILREPFEQFESAFKYYSRVFPRPYILNIIEESPDNPIETYLKDPLNYEKNEIRTSYTNNRMAIDFGFPIRNLEYDKKNRTRIDEFVHYIDSVFDLVLISEHLDASLVLVKRYLGWQTKDIIYYPSNVRKEDPLTSQTSWSTKDNITELRRLHRKWAPLDYALYEYFLTSLRRRFKAQIDFKEEVKAFQRVIKKVARFCTNNSTSQSLALPQSRWSSSFVVSHLDCDLMMMQEKEIVDAVRKHQTERLKWLF